MMVPQSQLLWDVHAVRYGQDTSCCLDAFLADDHGAVVQGAVFEEDVLDEPLVDVGVYQLSRAYDVVQRQAPFYHYQGAHLLFAHAHAGHHDGHYLVFLGAVFSPAVLLHPVEQALYLAVCADVEEEVAYLILKEDDEGQCAYAHQLVEDGAQQPHLKGLRYQQPEHNEHQHPVEHVQGA